MDATYIPKAIEQLKSNIFMHVRHRALLHYTGEPTLDQNQLFFIQLPFLNDEVLNGERIISATTVGIVHASLVEHDKIQEQNATSLEQQLTVLSGDYYSGRYYQLLAHTGNVLLIQKLSKGIVNRCEHQIAVYESANRSFAQWIESLTVIECELIEQFYDVYGFEAYKPYLKVALTIVRLQLELEKLENGQASLFGRALAESVLASQSIQDELHREIMALTGALDEQLQSSKLLNEELKQHIKSMTSRHK
ncbi:heptaprenyl diphosphate synthase component 1 [Solibacillus sp. FSL H8-0538]|uniref:heptaprenyl diphosphate synthase component 1 n=1 Tax=Solibacillus sp. FSL H8-0538 TaxID=2921400 RepID=UPI0030F88E48